MNIEERNKKIIKLKESGKTFRDIADRFDLCPTRIRMIYEREMEIEGRIKEYGDQSIYTLNLPNNISYAIERYGYNTIPELEKLIDSGEISKVRNIGVRSIEIIKEKLNERKSSN